LRALWQPPLTARASPIDRARYGAHMARPAIDPVTWRPPSIPARAKRARSDAGLPPLTLLPLPGVGPEDVDVLDTGDLVTGLEDGRILRVSPDGRRSEVLADTGGRPLGIEARADGTAVVCDAQRGLLRVDLAGGAVDVLVSAVAGQPLRFCNNAAVARDGTIYFTDSSRRFGLEHWKADLIEGRPTGRLLRRTPDGEIDVLLDDLRFANGVALSPDESQLIVAETAGYRVTTVTLSGADAGQTSPLLDNTPGFVDNVSTGSDGLYWLALPNPRDRVLDLLLAKPPALRTLLWALPERLHPSPVETVWVMAVAPDGTVVHDFHGPGPEGFAFVTGVREHAGTVVLSSLTSPYLARLDIPS